MNKEKRELVYSVLIIIAIPVLVVVNTLYISKGVRASYNTELRRKADVLNAVIAESLREPITSGDTASVSKKLSNLVKERPELAELMVSEYKNAVLTVIAKSDDVPKTLSPSTEFLQKVAYDKQSSIAKLSTVQTTNGAQQAWSVATPLISNETKQPIAVVSSSVLTTDAEELIAKVLQTSLFALVATIIIIVALLLRHMRLLSYGQLLAKQKEINQTMGDFLSVATHELKAPMSIIKGYISNVIEDTQPPLTADAKEQLNVALSQTDRLNGLVQDLLNVSRIEQGRVAYSLQPVILDEILNPIIKNYHVLAADKNISISYEPKPDLTVYADAGRTQEIFTNLIDNAIKYSLQGAVTITQKVDGKRVVTSIRDTGIGIGPEERKRLFQRFYRIKNDSTKDISGTGLGLWIIKQYIESMGGTIEVDSMVGVGSEFTVSLPMYGVQGKPA